MMKNDDILFLKNYVRTVQEPENLFSGKRLPHGFALPDNILIFFHDFTSPAPDAHGRHTLVFPLEKMIYFVERQRIELVPGMMLYVPPFALRFLHPDSNGYGRFFITFEVKGEQPYLPEPGGFDLTDSNWQNLRVFLDEFNSGSAVNAIIVFTKFLPCAEYNHAVRIMICASGRIDASESSPASFVLPYTDFGQV